MQMAQQLFNELLVINEFFTQNYFTWVQTLKKPCLFTYRNTVYCILTLIHPRGGRCGH